MKQLKKCVPILLAVLLLAGVVLPAFGVKADDSDFTAEMKVGFDNKAEILRYAPFAITMENNSSDFSGRIQLIVANKKDYNIMYETDFSIARGEKKTVTFSCKVIDNLGKVNIRLVNKKGKVVWSEIKRFNVDKSASKKIDIGILSDDYSALGYMDNLNFVDRETFQTNLVELTADNFPEDANALDMLEMIVISNFSTDILTDEQIEALNLWVNRGGVLVIGTGSNSSKTLSKIKGHVMDVNPEKMNRYTTSFGLNYYGYEAATTTTGNGQVLKSPYDDEDFMEQFDDLFFNYRDEMDTYFLEDFMANEGLTEDDLEDDGTLPSYWEDAYYDFCAQTMYGYQYEDVGTVTYSYPYATADVLEFSDKDSNEEMIEKIYGDNSAGEDYTLATVYQRASGYIALYGIDFTMNPVPGYANASEIIGVLIRSYVLQRVIDNYDSVSNNNYYNVNLGSAPGLSSGYGMDNLLEAYSSAPMPPLLFYLVPIIGYLVAILVLYLIGKKKKKTFRLWYWYPVLAIGVAVVVYCIGFSTRIIRPRINTATILDLEKPSAIEKNIVAVTTPSNKDCSVEFSDEYDLQLLKQLSFYGDQSDKIDYNSYRVGFRKNIDRTRVTFTGNVALSSDQFLLESIYPTNRYFDVQYVINVPQGKSLAESLIICNNTSVDLENAVLVATENTNATSSYVDAIVYRVGDWKNGQTIDFSDGKKRDYGYNTSIAFTDRDKHLISGALLGNLSEGFKTYTNRKNILEYLMNNIDDELRQYSSSSSNYSYKQQLTPQFVYVIGFPKESVCKDIQFDKKYRNERTEVIVEKINLSEMKQVKKQ